MNQNQLSMRRLSYFTVLADLLHFGKAAEALHISQPALSSEIRKLESELGLTLFVRKPRTALTREGVILRRRAQHLLAAAERFSSGAEDLAAGITGSVTIGCVQTFFLRGLPQAVTAIESERPGIRVQIVEMTTAEQLEQLDSGGVDIACGHSAAQSANLTSVRVASEEFRLCTHPDRPARTLADVAEEPFIIFRREVSPHYWEKVMSVCRAADFTPRVTHQTTTWNAVISLIRQGLGVSLVPAIIADTGEGFTATRLGASAVRSESWMTMRQEDEGSAVGRVFEKLTALLQ
ncbi:LysR family transcriptional regulator [Brevibacterium daeguense]|uniref:LysR family transcriptional regulator n=1 Tax=Brevibacterium daeguense TaxID=909936 RepID=A0ABP8EHA7_9MICO|nr:LysR substrate-binding domain-containing protein [Brevibacterium daeguense]